MVRDNLICDKHNVGRGTYYLAGSLDLGMRYSPDIDGMIHTMRCVSGLRAYWGHLSKPKEKGARRDVEARRAARRLFGGGMPPGYVCADCGAQGVKLWRPSCDTGPLRCEACGTKHEIAAGRSERSIRERRGDTLGYLLPAVPAEDGGTWGYTSVPEPYCIWWYRLPTKPGAEARTGTEGDDGR